MEAAIERSIEADRKQKQTSAPAQLPPGRRRWHIRTILAKCGSDPGAEFLLDQACQHCEAITQIGALHRLPDDKLLSLHREIDRHRDCAEQDATPHDFVQAWRG